MDNPTEPNSFGVKRRRVITSLASSAVLGVSPAISHASSDGVMRLYVGFPPGGSGDLFARILADGLREVLGRTVLVENKPGAGGTVVGSTFIRAPRDGNHVMLATGSTAISAPVSRARPPYNPVEDFQWIALLSYAPFVIAVHPSVPARNLHQLVDYARSRAGQLSYGHAGLGSTVHLAGELLKDLTGLKVVDVAYKGSGPAIQDTIAGNVHYVVETSGTLQPHHRSGRLRIVTCMNEIREAIAPDIRTSREDGVDIVAGTCNLLALPAGTSAEHVTALSNAVTQVITKPATLERLRALGITPIQNSTPQSARAFVAAEVSRWGAMAKKLGISL